MTLYDFNSLNLDKQLTVVWIEGACIDNHFSALERCNLYAIDMFWIEVIYNSEHNTITELRSFKTGHLLDKYSNLNTI